MKQNYKTSGTPLLSTAPSPKPPYPSQTVPHLGPKCSNTLFNIKAITEEQILYMKIKYDHAQNCSNLSHFQLFYLHFSERYLKLRSSTPYTLVCLSDNMP